MNDAAAFTELDRTRKPSLAMADPKHTITAEGRGDVPCCSPDISLHTTTPQRTIMERPSLRPKVTGKRTLVPAPAHDSTQTASNTTKTQIKASSSHKRSRPNKSESTSTDDRTFTLEDTLFVPSIPNNYFSIGRAADSGYNTTFDKTHAYVVERNTGLLIAIGHRRDDGLYWLSKDCIVNYKTKLGTNPHQSIRAQTTHTKPPTTPRALATGSRARCPRWHQRLAHRVDHQKIHDLKANGVTGLETIDGDGATTKCTGADTHRCVACIMGKAVRLPFGKKKKRYVRRATRALGRLYTDLHGPTRVEGWDGERYYMVIVDELTYYVDVYCLKTKDEAIQKYKDFNNHAKALHNKSIGILRCDGGGEFTSKEFRQFLKDEGTDLEHTVPRSSQQNGVAERLIGVLSKMARCLMQTCAAPQVFWREAILTAAYLHNLFPTKRLARGVTPYEVWFKQKADYDHIRTFGCRAYAVIHGSARDKFGDQARPCIFMGYSQTSAGYILFDDKINAFFTSDQCDVYFDEDVYPFAQLAPDDPLHDRGKTGENQAADPDYQPSETDEGDDSDYPPLADERKRKRRRQTSQHAAKPTSTTNQKKSNAALDPNRLSSSTGTSPAAATAQTRTESQNLQQPATHNRKRRSRARYDNTTNSGAPSPATGTHRTVEFSTGHGPTTKNNTRSDRHKITRDGHNHTPGKIDTNDKHSYDATDGMRITSVDTYNTPTIAPHEASHPSTERRSTRKRKQRDFGSFVDSNVALRSVRERKELKATIIAQQRLAKMTENIPEWLEASCENLRTSVEEHRSKALNTKVRVKIPRSVKEALSCPQHSHEWRIAIDKELEVLHDNETWDLVEAPKGRKILRSVWAFNVYYHDNGTIEKFKARL